MKINCRRRVVLQQLGNFDLNIFKGFFFHNLCCVNFIFVDSWSFDNLLLMVMLEHPLPLPLPLPPNNKNVPFKSNFISMQVLGQ